MSQGEDDGVDDGLGDEEQVGGGVEAEPQQGVHISVGQYTTWCSNPFIDIKTIANLFMFINVFFSYENQDHDGIQLHSNTDYRHT